VSQFVEEAIDPESAHVREVYARFGLAVYHAQCFEHGLANLNLTAHLVGAKGIIPTQEQWEALVDEVLDRSFEKTLGNLIKELKNVISIDAHALGYILEAKAVRDELCHRFFREHAEDFLTSTGRDRMLLKLEQLDRKICEASAMVDLIEAATAKHIGQTPEQRAAYFDAYEAEILARG
jgi:hypothetical protein